MTLCRFSESNSNSNYKCVIVCSEFFLKISLIYTSSDFFTEPSIVLQNQPLSTNSHARYFDLILKKLKENELKLKKRKYLAWSPFKRNSC